MAWRLTRLPSDRLPYVPSSPVSRAGWSEGLSQDQSEIIQEPRRDGKTQPRAPLHIEPLKPEVSPQPGPTFRSLLGCASSRI